MSNPLISGPGADPIELAELFGIDINAPSPPNGSAPATDANAREAVERIAYPSVRDALDLDSGDRSDDSFHVVATCQEAGLSIEQTRWVVDTSPRLAERVAEFLARTPPVDDVQVSWDRARVRNAWAAPAVGPQQAPRGQQQAPQPIPPSPGSFLNRAGLKARDLADTVMQTIVCGFGRPDQQLYVYDNGVWTVNDGRIEAEVARLLGNRYRSAHAHNVLDLIRFTPSVSVIADRPLAEFINVPNGMIHWRSGQLLGHDPTYLSTTQLPVEYDPGADCPVFRKFIAEVLPRDLYEPTADSPGFIWELIGYAMYSGNPMHVAILLFGQGRNGKGTLIRVLKALLGEHNCSSVALHELIENKFRAATLFRKLANLAGDLDAKWLESTALFKKITGNDSIQAEHKYAKPFDFTPWAVPFYSTNKAFGSADSSTGWMKRWIVVPFPTDFSGHEDRDLDAKLQTDNELRGIMRRGVEALPDLMTRGGFAEPQTLAEAKDDFVTASDSVRAFIDECFDLCGDPAIFLPRTKIWETYYWQMSGENPKAKLGQRELYNRVGQISGITPHKRDGVRGFTGIGTKSGSQP
jgi:putative DNA primase/helicase